MAAISSMPSSSTQYNDIAGAYAKLCPAWPARSPFLLPDLEEEQLKRVLLSPEVAMRGKSVLDLAGETGTIPSAHWTGARNIMVDAGRAVAEKQAIPQSRIRFSVADATAPDGKIEGAPFDIVTAAWLLNHAPNAETSPRMWQNIGL
ncbi:uncharacterized protein HMPREF1541_05722 [Cyphellophora europaea CBS 101466]|uniref:Methyltransferase domain-containing protein n=1 Tax=Cyphellophora europaea (strain CBS 101466) TaxID=1220924 RepID=W2RSL2_CYPE1|nr:uncharacterized protein HMPREF1541_05722 [Cyphellophora europaea CBS 101466]ETN39496.1 hypothetical protein HMPREF1541_05722 [Cyphellophora europaea CBS 101466]